MTLRNSEIHCRAMIYRYSGVLESVFLHFRIYIPLVIIWLRDYYSIITLKKQHEYAIKKIVLLFTVLVVVFIIFILTANLMNL